MAALNVLLITLDQFRGDCLSRPGIRSCARPTSTGSPQAGVRLARHYSQAAPCGPGRASLYTGMYQMNHRVVGNGTPLDARFDNVALAARRAGYEPALFGYTDQSIDPRQPAGPDDPWLSTLRRHASRVRRGARPARRPRAVGRVARRASATHVGRADEARWPPRASGRPSTACRRSSPTARSTWLGARTSRGSPTSATSARTRRTRRPGSGHAPTTRRTSVCPSLRPTTATGSTTWCSVIPAAGAHGRVAAAPDASAVLRDDQGGRRPARPGVDALRRSGVGRHVGRSSRPITARCSAITA